MNKTILSAVLSCSAIMTIAAPKTDDPVLMTIDGKDVKLSEFEYLYNKNNSQQVEPVTFDQYVDMFIDYKLKVADAKACGIDTTQSFKKEFAKFTDDLAKPYLKDNAVEEKLINDAYKRMGEEVYVSHIMFAAPSPQDPVGQEALADSVYRLIKDGKITFEEAARTYSIDKQSAINGGLMGWVVGNSRLPWQFEEASFNTPVGEISEVVNSGVGYHIIRPEKKRPASGEVNAQHILILTRGLDDAAKELAKAKIDSIYNVVTTPGVDFAEVATRESQDPGSARRGGDLGWFGRGMMVAEFDSVSFELADNQISKPFATSYGYHIVKKLGHRGGAPIAPLEEVRDQIVKSIENDSRSQMATNAKIDQIAAESNSRNNKELTSEIEAFLKNKGFENCDSIAMQALLACDIPAYWVNGKPVTVGELLVTKPIRQGADVASTARFVRMAATFGFQQAMMDIGRQQLYDTNPDYRNLVNEYRDGIMLFDISNKNVWNKATEDPESLETYFKANASKYAWEQPKFKGYVIFATNDSIMNEAKSYAEQNYNAANLDQKEFTADLKKKFGRDIKIEKVIASQGENQFIDYLGFNGKYPEVNDRWPAFFAFASKIITEPEEASDVKGQVTSDYQNALEKEWLKQLHDKYKVKINNSTRKKAAQRAAAAK